MRATELGLRQYSWWPDWRDECVAIVASGPTIKLVNVDCLKDRVHVIAIKQTLEKCRWAEIVYGCDAAWWNHRKGLPEFRGIKLSHGTAAIQQFKDIRKVSIKMVDEILVDEPLLVGNGGNSGFQAVNLAIQFGAKNIILIGFDLHDRGGAHWYGRNTAWGMNNPMRVNFDRWRNGFDAVKRRIKELDVDVVNVSPDSDLHAFRKQPLDEVLREWGL